VKVYAAAGTTPRAYACDFADALIAYELAFAVDDFTVASGVQSEVIRRVADAFQSTGIPVGAPATDVRIMQQGNAAVAKSESVTG
jgi:small-conductance mechanosensitive channel